MTPLFFPDIVGHCFLSLGFDSHPKDDELCHAATASVHVPWNTTCLEIGDRAHGEIVNTLMAFIGADPETATMEDLDDDMEYYQVKWYGRPNEQCMYNGAVPIPTFELYRWRNFVSFCFFYRSLHILMYCHFTR